MDPKYFNSVTTSDIVFDIAPKINPHDLSLKGILTPLSEEKRGLETDFVYICEINLAGNTN